MKFALIKMSQYFPKPFRSFGENTNVKVGFSNYATKKWSKKYNTRWYKFCTKNKLSQSKNEVDKLDIDKLVPVPLDLSKLSDVDKNGVVKKLLMIN